MRTILYTGTGTLVAGFQGEQFTDPAHNLHTLQGFFERLNQGIDIYVDGTIHFQRFFFRHGTDLYDRQSGEERFKLGGLFRGDRHHEAAVGFGEEGRGGPLP